MSGLDVDLFGPRGRYELVVVSDRDHFVYTPLLPAVASGAIEASSIVTPMRNVIGGRGTFVKAFVEDVDFHSKSLIVSKKTVRRYVDPDECGAGGECSMREREVVDRFRVRYDALVCATGAKTATFGVPGVREHCVPVRTHEDSQRIRRRFEACLDVACDPNANKSRDEIRRLMTVVVVGGGPTGVEIAAELQEALDDDFERYCSVRGYSGALWPNVKIVTNTAALLPTFSAKSSAYATERLRLSGVDEMLDHFAVAVESGGVRVKSSKTGDEVFVDAATVVWAGGVEASVFTKSVAGRLASSTGVSSKRGVVVDDYMRAIGGNGCEFWIGDAAATSVDHSRQLPPTAQVARGQGEYVAGLLNSGAFTFDGKSPVLSSDVKPFEYRSKGQMAYVGRGAAAVDFPGDVSFTGEAAGILFKAFETFSQKTVDGKLRVARDFIKTSVEGRKLRG